MRGEAPRTLEMPPDDEDLDAGNAQNEPGLRRILQIARGEWCWLALGTVLLIVGLVPLLVMPLYFGWVIDDISDTSLPSDEQKTRINKHLIELCGLIGISAFAVVGRTFIFNASGERVVARLRVRLFHAIIRQDVAMFDKRKTGELLSRLTADTTSLQDVATSNVSMFIRSVVQILISFGLMFVTCWPLATLIVIVVPIAVLIVAVYGRMLKRLSTTYSDALGHASDVAQQSVSNIRTVRSFAAEDIESGKYENAVGDPDNPSNRQCCWYPKRSSSYKSGIQRVIAGAVFQGILTLLGLGVITLVIWFGAYQVIEGKIRPGSLISFILYSVQIGGSLGMMSGLVVSLFNAKGASKRTFQLIDRTPEIPVKGGQKLENMKGGIQFENVSFSYPARADVMVLKNFTLDIPKNNRFAFVGHSGAGKSTILSLIQRFYDVTEGKILIDGVPLTSLDPSWLRQNFAYVQQEPVLFGGTIAQNIAYGYSVRMGSAESVPPQEELERHAKDAYADEFICGFPDRYDTVVGERGVRLSGGQKQRIAIARALLMDPRVLLLDEATSALDTESEARVADAINKAMVGRTTLIVAHRLSTVQNADAIVLVDDGTIADTGTHDELLQRCVKYQELVRRQLRNHDGVLAGKQTFGEKAVPIAPKCDGDTMKSPLLGHQEDDSQTST